MPAPDTLKISKRNCESEKALEARLVEEIKKRGGVAVKLTSQFHRGLPDRLVLLPFHTMAFVELKSTGGRVSPLQVAAIEQLRQMHFCVRVVTSAQELDELLETLDRRLDEQKDFQKSLKSKGREMRLALKEQRFADKWGKGGKR